MIKPTKRLSLKSETLRPLSGDQLDLVIGGNLGDGAATTQKLTTIKTIGDTIHRPQPL